MLTCRMRKRKTQAKIIVRLIDQDQAIRGFVDLMTYHCLWKRQVWSKQDMDERPS